jgi:hypothetical protein
MLRNILSIETGTQNTAKQFQKSEKQSDALVFCFPLGLPIQESQDVLCGMPDIFPRNAIFTQPTLSRRHSVKHTESNFSQK